VTWRPKSVVCVNYLRSLPLPLGPYRVLDSRAADLSNQYGHRNHIGITPTVWDFLCGHRRPSSFSVRRFKDSDQHPKHNVRRGRVQHRRPRRRPRIVSVHVVGRRSSHLFRRSPPGTSHSNDSAPCCRRFLRKKKRDLWEGKKPAARVPEALRQICVSMRTGPVSLLYRFGSRTALLD
jgi:hypothetical protein